MDFTYEKHQYPNGSWYIEMKVGKEIVGHAIEVAGGFLANGRRKPVATLKEAAEQCLDSRMNNCMNEYERLGKMLEIVLSSS